MDGLKVRKRDGRLQDFDRTKIATSIAKAGGLPEQAEEIAAQVESWVAGVATGRVVDSSAIRAKIIELLRRTNPEAAETFEQYRKPSQL
jgi:transcriptional regulator NrdR family protein